MTSGPIAVAVGDPGGVGPRVALAAALELAHGSRLVLFGDASQLSEQARVLGADSNQLVVVESAAAAALGLISIVDTGRIDRALLARHEPTVETGRAQLETLRRAAQAVLRGEASVLATGPTSKEAVASSGVDFRGQTEFLAELVGLEHDAVTMMFLGPRLKVALVTTHEAIADVPRLVTAARIQRSVLHLAQALACISTASERRILVAGLNPHAGEHGVIGAQDDAVIAPAVAAIAGLPDLRELDTRVEGPVGAETALRFAARGDVHGVVAMFHDQATIASKLLDFGDAVNVTWGLPFVRTSVDHGVAYDAARWGTADASGMRAAILLAGKLGCEPGSRA